MNIVVKKYQSGEIYFKPDSTLCREGDLYFPDYLGSEFIIVPSLIIRSLKNAKCVRREFSPRYYADFSIGLNIYSVKYLKQSLSNPFEIYRATSFDNSSYICSCFSKTENLPNNTSCNIIVSSPNSKERNELITEDLSSKEILDHFNLFFEEATRLFSLKSGDLLFLEQSQGVIINRDDKINLQTQEIDCSFCIR